MSGTGNGQGVSGWDHSREVQICKFYCIRQVVSIGSCRPCLWAALELLICCHALCFYSLSRTVLLSVYTHYHSTMLYHSTILVRQATCSPSDCKCNSAVWQTAIHTRLLTRMVGTAQLDQAALTCLMHQQVSTCCRKSMSQGMHAYVTTGTA